jgi:hypothetical protein
MKTSSCILICLLLVSFAFAKKLKTSANYRQTCRDMHLDDQVWLRGSCQTMWGNWINAEVNLNGCIQNNNAHLEKKQNGSYGLSCGGCWLTGTGYSTLGCTCKNVYGAGINNVFIELNNFIDNTNGALICQF